MKCAGATALGAGLRADAQAGASGDPFASEEDSADIASDPVCGQIDDLMESFLTAQSVTAAQVAIRCQGRLIMNRGYKNAGNGYPEVTTKTLFRLASCSKLFVAAAINALSQEDLLDLQAKVFPLLGITSPALPAQLPSPYIDDITVIQLINHAGGWNDHGTVTATDGTVIPGTNWDPMFQMREITHRLGIARPVMKRDIAAYMYGEPLQFRPGTQNFDTTQGASYSNLGYLLLGLVIEEVTGEPFVDYLRSRFSSARKPLAVYLSRTLGGPVQGREVWYTSLYTGLSALEPHAQVTVPFPYGGEGWMTESADGNGGLMTTAATLSQFITRHAVWGMGGRTIAARDGSQAGTSSYAQSLPNGVDCVFLLNTRDFNDGSNALTQFTNQFVDLVGKL